jgi:hypothetical protein
METTTHTTDTTTEFKIDSMQLINMYNSFVENLNGPIFMSDKEAIRGYKLATEIQFNSFKIFFGLQLIKLGLDVKLS